MILIIHIYLTIYFIAKDIKSNDFYAIKRELKDSSQLYHEFKFYKALKGGRKYEAYKIRCICMFIQS